MFDSSAAVAAFDNRAFGLFVHWGLYAQLARGEWVWHYHYPDRRAEYLRLFDAFTAADFDADALVGLAAEAGCRYVCLTTRHHEGFSLYDTRGLNDFDAPHSPAGRDLVAEFAEACDRHGMGKFFYHTTLDWWHPQFDQDWDAYQDYLRASIDLLCRHYGRVDGFWFDGNWWRPERDWQEDRLYELIRRQQPDCVIVNNSSHGHHGEAGHPEVDVVTYEQGRPGERRFADGKARGGEMCETITSHWGVADRDLSHKSPADLIERIADCRRVRANLLLNIGPTATGAVPAYEREVLRLVGRWTDRQAHWLYEAEPTELRCRRQDYVLRRGDRFFYVCYGVGIRGNEQLDQPLAGHGLQSIAGELPPVRRIAWLDEPEADLPFSQDPGRLVFDATPFPYGRQEVVRVAVLQT